MKTRETGSSRLIFYGQRVGVYDKGRDFTSDFYGVRVCDGDGIVVLIMKAAEQDN